MPSELLEVFEHALWGAGEPSATLSMLSSSKTAVDLSGMPAPPEVCRLVCALLLLGSRSPSVPMCWLGDCVLLQVPRQVRAEAAHSDPPWRRTMLLHQFEDMRLLVASCHAVQCGLFVPAVQAMTD